MYLLVCIIYKYAQVKCIHILVIYILRCLMEVFSAATNFHLQNMPGNKLAKGLCIMFRYGLIKNHEQKLKEQLICGWLWRLNKCTRPNIHYLCIHYLLCVCNVCTIYDLLKRRHE